MQSSDFDNLLKAVSAALVEDCDLSERLPRPANDNAVAWPFIQFPDNWYAAC